MESQSRRKRFFSSMVTDCDDLNTTIHSVGVIFARFESGITAKAEKSSQVVDNVYGTNLCRLVIGIADV